jgi:hypothetical protein
MYAIIRKLLPERIAIFVAALIYSLMLTSILYFSFEKQATFSYLNL